MHGDRQDEPDCDTARDFVTEEHDGRFDEHLGTDDGGYRDREQGEGSGVVDQAFSGEDGDDPLRQSEFPPDRDRADRVGGCDDGTEDQRRSEGEFRYQPFREERDGEGSDQDRPDTQPENVRQIALEGGNGESQRRRVQQRRQDDPEKYMRLEFQPWQAGRNDAIAPITTSTSGACRFPRFANPVTAIAAMTTSRIQVPFTGRFSPETAAPGT